MDYKIKVQVDGPTGLTNQMLEQVVDEDVRLFSEWFCSRVDQSTQALSVIEASIIKTYLWWKTHGSDESKHP